MKVKIVKEMIACDVSLVAMLTMYLGKGGCNRWCQNTGIAKKGGWGGGSDPAKISANLS